MQRSTVREGLRDTGATTVQNLRAAQKNQLDQSQLSMSTDGARSCREFVVQSRNASLHLREAITLSSTGSAFAEVPAASVQKGVLPCASEMVAGTTKEWE